MSIPRTLRAAALFLLGCGAPFAAPPAARAAEGTVGITAVSSRVSKDYVRTRLPDGSFQPEEYAFGDGGQLDGPYRDASIDKLSFMDIARVIAVPLRAQNYLPSKDLNTEKLLIMLYWGTTVVPDDLSMSVGYMNHSVGYMNHNYTMTYLDNMQRDLLDFKNAKILGYDSEESIESDFGNFFTNTGVPGLLRNELISEIESNRFFVVMMAYDFQVLRKQNKHKMLWQTRFNIDDLHNHFDKALPAMAQYASRYFGQDSHGLLRKHVPEGHVEVGVPKSVGMELEKGDSPSTTTPVAETDTLSARTADVTPDLSALPPALARHIAAYRQEKTALQNALAAKIKTVAPGEETRRAIDNFNAENSARIAALNRDAVGIRDELAKFAAANLHPSADQSIDTLVRQFNDRIKEMEIVEPLLTHP